MENIYEFSADALTGEPISLSDYRGAVVLIVNTASRCGFTPQYAGLQGLFEQYRQQGFFVLGFPCNQFGAQEPGSAKEITEFCQTQYDVSFPMFAKIEVNGPHAHPLYAYLKSHAPGLLGSQDIKWNFTKFLIGRDGRVCNRFAPLSAPASLTAEIESALVSSPR